MNKLHNKLYKGKNLPFEFMNVINNLSPDRKCDKHEGEFDHYKKEFGDSSSCDGDEGDDLRKA